MKIMYEICDKALKDKVPKAREYQKKEIKAMIELFSKKDKMEVKKLISKDPSLIFILQYITIGKSKDVEILLSDGTKLDIRNIFGWTPLIYAAVAGNIEVMNLLLSFDNDKDAKDCRKQTALAKACVYDRYDIVQLLVEE